MKKANLFFPLLLFLLACMFVQPTPDDFPSPPPMTIIVEIPQVTAVPTFETRTRPIKQSDLSDAETFLLIIKTQIAAGDNYGFAEKVHYPINVDSEGKMIPLTKPDQFVEHFNSIVNEKILNTINTASENDLLILPEGIRVGQGELWLNLFCVDAACSDAQFLITQINN